MSILPAATLAAALLAAPVTTSPRPAPPALGSTSARSPRRPKVPVPTDPVLRRHLAGKKVLLLGDSMIVTGLEIWMRALITANGGRMERWAWASSSTESWATGPVLDRALRRHKPDLVLVVLGSNELYLEKPAERSKHVRTILARLAPRPCRWLGPPVWGRQTGIVEVLEASVPKGRFYPFNGRGMERHRDGKHPSPWGSRAWAYDFAVWWIARLKAEGN